MSIEFTDDELKELHILISLQLIEAYKSWKNYPEFPATKVKVDRIQELHDKILEMRYERGWKP